MSRMRVVGLTEHHLGEIDKPNEDAWLVGYSPTVIALADGITRSRLPDGTYPAEYATVAPECFVRTVVAKLCSSVSYSLENVQRAVAEANWTIGRENSKRGINSRTVDYGALDYLGTTGCVLCVDLSEGRATFAFLGDVIAIYLPRADLPRLLTRDQLRNCHNFSYTHFSKIEKAERLLWQRRVARNHFRATDPAGHCVGYGAFTGETEALKFLEISEFTVEAGDRFILASDALRVTAEVGETEEEAASSYEAVLKVARETTFEELPGTLIRLIRRHETEKNVRSDDATIVVAEV